jgi:hypothetical protein
MGLGAIEMTWAWEEYALGETERDTGVIFVFPFFPRQALIMFLQKGWARHEEYALDTTDSMINFVPKLCMALTNLLYTCSVFTI